MTDDTLIPDPILDPRTEAQVYVQGLDRTIGNYTEDDPALYREAADIIEARIEDGVAIPQGNLPEINSPRPAEVVPTLLRAWAMVQAFVLYYLNQSANKIRIALLRLLGVELLPAAAATTTLRFTKTEDFIGQEVVIPPGTEVTTEDREQRVVTVSELVIPAATASGDVMARATVEGDTRLPVGSIGLIVTALPGISSITNIVKLTGGANAETVDQGKIRARKEMAIGQHLGSDEDYKVHLEERVLRKNGRVTVFERYLSDFSQSTLGYVTIVVQGADGLAPTQQLLNDISAVVNQRHIAGLYVSVRPPIFKAFDITADVKITQGQSATTLINKAKANLALLYDPLRFAYGPAQTERYLATSDVIGQIEAASPNGISAVVDSIAFIIGGTAFKSDVPLLIGEMPQLGTVTLNVVS